MRGCHGGRAAGSSSLLQVPWQRLLWLQLVGQQPRGQSTRPCGSFQPPPTGLLCTLTAPLLLLQGAGQPQGVQSQPVFRAARCAAAHHMHPL